jgi:hypothetical protein
LCDVLRLADARFFALALLSSVRLSPNVWLAAFHLMCASKKGISAHQGHRMLGVTYKTA